MTGSDGENRANSTPFQFGGSGELYRAIEGGKVGKLEKE